MVNTIKLMFIGSLLINCARAQTGNPIIKDKFTTDPAAIVHNDSVYLYTGHDEAPVGLQQYVMHDWLCSAGPFRDARGSALITNDMTTEIKSDKDDIDPTVLIDDNGQAYIFWGNGQCYYAKLKKNMIELDGPITTVKLPHFMEGSWISKRNGWYYLSYAYQFPEKIAYAMSRSIDGPWEFKGILNEVPRNSQTNSPAILNFKGQSYFIYHNGALPTGGSYRRSVCIDYLYYNPDGTMKQVIMTSEGAKPVK